MVLITRKSPPNSAQKVLITFSVKAEDDFTGFAYWYLMVLNAFYIQIKGVKISSDTVSKKSVFIKKYKYTAVSVVKRFLMSGVFAWQIFFSIQIRKGKPILQIWEKPDKWH